MAARYSIAGSTGEYEISLMSIKEFGKEIEVSEFSKEIPREDCYALIKKGFVLTIPPCKDYADSGISENKEKRIVKKDDIVCSIRSSFVYGTYGAISNKNGYTITECIPDQDIAQSIEYIAQNTNSYRNRNSFSKHIPWKNVISPIFLMASYAPMNYYHWIFDNMPYLNGLSYCKDADSIPICFHDPYNGGAFIARSLRAAGFSDDRWIMLEGGILFCEQILFRTRHFGPTPEKIEFLRSTFSSLIAPKEASGRRLFIMRSQDLPRKIKNIDSVASTLSKFSISAWNPSGFPFEEQVKIASECDVLIGIHGAGLANAAFMRPGSTLIELTHKETLADENYRTLCASGNINYIRVICGLDEEQDVNDPKNRDFYVPISAFEAALRETISGGV